MNYVQCQYYKHSKCTKFKNRFLQRHSMCENIAHQKPLVLAQFNARKYILEQKKNNCTGPHCLTGTFTEIPYLKHNQDQNQY